MGRKDESSYQDAVEQLNEYLDRLSPDEQGILNLLFGLKGNRRHSPEELASILGIPLNTVLELEADALRKLRDSDL